VRAFLLLLLFCTSVAFAQSPQVDKHAGQASDELLTEGFEDSDWELNWTLVRRTTTAHAGAQAPWVAAITKMVQPMMTG
jgi:hypothetical protein